MGPMGSGPNQPGNMAGPPNNLPMGAMMPPPPPPPPAYSNGKHLHLRFSWWN